MGKGYELRFADGHTSDGIDHLTGAGVRPQMTFVLLVGLENLSHGDLTTRNSFGSEDRRYAAHPVCKGAGLIMGRGV